LMRALSDVKHELKKTEKALGAAANSTSVAQNTSLPGDPFQAVVDRAWDAWPLLREAVMLARARCDLQREALMSQLSKAWQKPDYCVRRDSAGPECEGLFPRAESWDSDWYVGSVCAEAPPVNTSRPEVRKAAAAKRTRKVS